MNPHPERRTRRCRVSSNSHVSAPSSEVGDDSFRQGATVARCASAARPEQAPHRRRRRPTAVAPGAEAPQARQPRVTRTRHSHPGTSPAWDFSIVSLAAVVGLRSRPRQHASASSPAAAGELTDEQALERYRYLVRTAPPEAIEQAHEEAFAELTPEQRRAALRDLSAAVPEHERTAGDDPRSLARMATRAEMNRPGTGRASLRWRRGHARRHGRHAARQLRGGLRREPGRPVAVLGVRRRRGRHRG